MEMSGYEDFDRRLLCVFCGKLLKDAVQFHCGCRLCEKCAEDAATEDRLNCGACGDVLTNEGGNLVSLNCDNRPRNYWILLFFGFSIMRILVFVKKSRNYRNKIFLLLMKTYW